MIRLYTIWCSVWASGQLQHGDSHNFGPYIFATPSTGSRIERLLTLEKPVPSIVVVKYSQILGVDHIHGTESCSLENVQLSLSAVLSGKVEVEAKESREGDGHTAVGGDGWEADAHSEAEEQQ
jgi:hypothetical protein